MRYLGSRKIEQSIQAVELLRPDRFLHVRSRLTPKRQRFLQRKLSFWGDDHNAYASVHSAAGVPDQAFSLQRLKISVQCRWVDARTLRKIADGYSALAGKFGRNQIGKQAELIGGEAGLRESTIIQLSNLSSRAPYAQARTAHHLTKFLPRLHSVSSSCPSSAHCACLHMHINPLQVNVFAALPAVGNSLRCRSAAGLRPRAAQKPPRTRLVRTPAVRVVLASRKLTVYTGNSRVRSARERNQIVRRNRWCRHTLPSELVCPLD